MVPGEGKMEGDAVHRKQRHFRSPEKLTLTAHTCSFPLNLILLAKSLLPDLYLSN